MAKYICRACGYVFSVENPEPEYTEITETDGLPDEFKCPKCGASKSNIEKIEE
ncbi:MAG: rubredoxin [Eubacteriales bacterium]|nr:rubredoxin [Eubacteriales bacterium]